MRSGNPAPPVAPAVQSSAAEPAMPPQALVCSRLVLVAAVFCLLVCGVMVAQHFLAKPSAPLKSPQLESLKEQQRAHPKDEQLKQAIGVLDLELRRRHFRLLALNWAGAWMLLGAAVVVVVAGKKEAALKRGVYLPQPKTNVPEQAARVAALSRRAVIGLGICAAIGLLSLTLGTSTFLPQGEAEIDKLLAKSGVGGGVGPVDLPSSKEMLNNWPRFLGPVGNSFVAQTNLPITWDVASGAGVAWKAPVPAAGFNSPIVWEKRVFLSGGDAAKREVLCYDASSGTLLWQRPVQNVPGSPGASPEVPEQTGYAASTVATDGRRVYAIFANGDLAAFKFDGTLAWAKHLGVPKNPYGHASSLVTWQGRLLVQLDQGEVEAGKSRLYALDGPTGNVLWQRPRPVPSSWATPVVVEAAGKTQIVTLGVPWVIAYAAADGNELWRADALAGEVTPSPLAVGDLVIAVSPSDKMVAIRPGGQGDVSKTHLAWTAEDNVPDITSPASNGALIFTVTTPGTLTCYDAKDGKKQYEQDLNIECNASPALAGDRLYMFGRKGPVIVAEAGRQFKELARMDMGEPVFASPAFAAGRMYVRTAKNLFCLGVKDEKLAKTAEGAK